MSSFTDKQKNDVKTTAMRRIIKAAAKTRNRVNGENLANYSREIQESKNFNKLILRPDRRGGYKKA